VDDTTKRVSSKTLVGRDIPEKLIDVRELSFAFDGAREKALKKVSTSVFTGDFVSILGANGSGKTTLAMAMCGLIPNFFFGSFEGDVLVKGKSTLGLKVGEITRDVGILLQDYNSQIFFPTPMEEMEFVLDNMGLPQKRAKETALRLGISHLFKKPFATMSEGEKQKCVIASILCVGPKALILDEPASQLDPKERCDLRELLKKLHGEGTTIVLVTHDTELAALGNRFMFLWKGKLQKETRERNFLSSESCAKLGVEPLNDTPVIKKKVKPKNLGTVAIFDGVSFSFDEAKKGKAKGEKILDDVDLELNLGECTLLLGANGSGKTTLAKHLIKLLGTQEGKLEVLGRDVSTYSQREIARNVAYLFQNPERQLFKSTVREEIEFSLSLVDEELSERAIEKVLLLLGIKALINRNPQALSGGEKQRVALGAALATKPKLAILDEPMAYLDYPGRLELLDYLFALKESGVSLLIITHHPEWYKSLVQKTIVMERGKAKIRK